VLEPRWCYVVSFAIRFRPPRSLVSIGAEFVSPIAKLGRGAYANLQGLTERREGVAHEHSIRVLSARKSSAT
jgi:hypothetical protein